MFKTSIFLFFIASSFIQADEIQWWKISDNVPVFYQEPSESSQVLPALQPNQTVVVLTEKKDWYKLANSKTGETGWVLKTKIKPTVVEKINTKESSGANSYSYRSIHTTSNAPFSLEEAKKLQEKTEAYLNDMEKNFQKMEKQISTMFSDLFQNYRKIPLQKDGKNIENPVQYSQNAATQKSSTTKTPTVKLNQ